MRVADPVALLLLSLVAETLFVFAALLAGYGAGRALTPALGLEARPYRPVAAMAALGAALGALSLVAIPAALTRDPLARGASLVIAPLLAGAALAGLGRLSRKHGESPRGIESFAAGFAFALAFASVRLAFAA